MWMCGLHVWQQHENCHHGQWDVSAYIPHLWTCAWPENVYNNFQSRKLFECPSMAANLPAGGTVYFQHIADLFNLESTMSLKKAVNWHQRPYDRRALRGSKWNWRRPFSRTQHATHYSFMQLKKAKQNGLEQQTSSASWIVKLKCRECEVEDKG